MFKKQFSLGTLLALLLGLLLIVPASAVPPQPSGFYGTVTIDGNNIPDGTSVTAWINGVQYAQADSQTYNGDSVYTLNVPGDDTETPTQIEGGIAGDTIVFRVDGQEADQTATWNEGSLNELNLTVSSPSPTATPTATPTSSPTATQTTPPTSTPTHTPTVPPTPSIIHVKADASGASDGSSWANAYTDLQAALAVATAGDEIWVAAGTYKPSDTNRAASFHLKNGVAIYGGFNGTETSRDKRDWEANPTILSGDLNGDDNDNINTTEPTRAENSLHVVIAHSTDGSALLDGFTITGGNCNEGTPDGDGGGMYILSGSPTLQNLIFMDNSAGDGGALSTENGHPTLTNVTFSNNFANDDGGAISNHHGNLLLEHVSFINNSAQGDGGGIFNFSADPIIRDSSFINNSAYKGGGMHNQNNSLPIISQSVFTNNSVTRNGGAMHNLNSNPTVTSVTFSDNSAAHEGGGMFNWESSPTVSEVTFSGNSADGDGGGMYNGQNSKPEISLVTFISNSALSAGGMYNISSSPTLINVAFKGNSASSHTGGMYNHNSSPMMSNCIFSGNRASEHGGGMRNSNNSNPVVTNCTFSGNATSNQGGGIYNSGASNPTVINTILWNNQDSDGTGARSQIDDQGDSLTTVTYSLIEGDFAGTGNIDADPLFINPINPADAPTTDGDFRLQPTSPAIDAGDNSAVATDTTDLDADGDTTEVLPFDLDGNARFIDAPVADSGNGTAPIVDMGAYEMVTIAPTPTPTATNTPTPTPTPTNPTATPTPPPTGTPIIEDVRSSNVRDVSFTVSWLTDIVTSGQVRYGTDPNNLNQIANDTRGMTTVDKTHYVSLAELLANTTYYFDVISDGVTDNNNGNHYSLTTGPTLDVPRSDTIYGQILQADGTSPASGAIVYITLQDADGAGSTNQAGLLSALVDSNGDWGTNLGNARIEDLSGYFLYNANGDRLSLEALAGSDDSGCQRIDTANDAPSAALVLDDSLCTTTTWPINIQPSWNHIALPLDPIVPYTTENLCAQGSNSIDEVDRWHNGGWDGHLCDQPFNNFTLALGAGYFIRANQADTWTIEGTVVTEPVPFDLQNGWNSINIPHTDAYTAESLCGEIISQGVTALEIDRWHLGGWDGHICGMSFNDFDIERGTGYFVKTNSSGSVTPSEVAGKRQATPLPPASPDDLPTGETLPVRSLRISNLNDMSVTLSWLTDEATTGYVQFGENADRLTQVAYDNRDATTSSKTHLVVLDNLTPETTYHFEIISGAEVVERGTFMTLSSLTSIPDSDTIYGQVFWADGTTPAAGTLVYITLQDADGEGSEGEATPLVVLTDNNGYWHANLGNARHATSGDAFTYAATGDEVLLSVQSRTNSRTTITLDTSLLRSATPIILKDSGPWQLYLPLIGNSKSIQNS